MMSELFSPDELHRRKASPPGPTVIDVGDPDEYAAAHIPGAVHIPADELPRRLAEILVITRS